MNCSKWWERVALHPNYAFNLHAMQSILYIVWFSIPSLFFLLALWIKLERVSGRTKTENPKDLFNQGLFTLGCVFTAVFVDKFFLPSIVEMIGLDLFPLGFYQVFLLPLILLLAAKIVGPSKSILIAQKGGSTKPPSKRKK
jgi:hypothetical protein